MGCSRVVVRSEDLFVQDRDAWRVHWVIGQAVINVGAVLGLLPVVASRCRWSPAAGRRWSARWSRSAW
jgi:hypothetical protein